MEVFTNLSEIKSISEKDHDTKYDRGYPEEKLKELDKLFKAAIEEVKTLNNTMLEFIRKFVEYHKTPDFRNMKIPNRRGFDAKSRYHYEIRNRFTTRGTNEAMYNSDVRVQIQIDGIYIGSTIRNEPEKMEVIKKLISDYNENTTNSNILIFSNAGDRLKDKSSEIFQFSNETVDNNLLNSFCFVGCFFPKEKIEKLSAEDFIKEFISYEFISTILNIYFIAINKEEDMNDNLNHNIDLANVLKNKSQVILYGPPGTGKTYETVSRAVQIVEDLSLEALNEKYNTRKALKEKFQDYLENEQIQFISFHQSFSYEDFIEGIKPKIEKSEEDDGSNNGEIKYNIEDGVFKQIVSKADAARTKSLGASNYNIDESKFKNVQYFKMSLGNTALDEEAKVYDYCIINNLIGLGYGYDIDFSSVKTINDIKKLYEDNGYEIKDKNDYRITAVNRFLNWMKPGDIVFISNGNKKLRAVGKIKSNEYIYKKDAPIHYHQFKEVEWLLKEIDIPVRSFYYKNFSQQTIYQMSADEVDTSIFTQNVKTNSEPKKYVLIIDEINRGNIASIFGELITLIEEDKRLGRREVLSTELPYSKEKFTVPDNLYLIATMNTADRSVEALDTALRRRFVFEEIRPQPELINPSALIVNLWQQYDGIGDWQQEPFYTRAQKLYEFLGFDDKEFKLSKEFYKKLDGMNWNQIDKGEVISAGHFTGLKPDSLLNAINIRIKKLIDKDHCIGHSYFLSLIDCEDPLDELKRIFKNQIIPLLQEYFFGDPAKIGLVLGDKFVDYEKETDSRSIFANFNYGDYDEFEDINTIKIKDIDAFSVEDFETIYAKLSE